MIRLFDTHEIRRTKELNGSWDFEPIAAASEDLINYTYQIPVPGSWESHPHLASYRGKGTYRKIVHVSQPSTLRLCFKGVSHTADVYFDGVHVAHHYNAYTQFAAIVPNVELGDHELVVIVDNSFSEESTLHIPNDYYTYGGIIRPVVLEYIPDIFVERIGFTPKQENDIWKAEIKVYVSNVHNRDHVVFPTIDLAGIHINFSQTTVTAGSTIELRADCTFPDISPWSHETPNLYLLKVHLYEPGDETPIDDLVERVGFRTVNVADGMIQVNGRDVKLKGFNRHEDHPLVGASIPYSLMVQDIELILDTGANALRTSHYPNDERFLDLCDERGIYVWEENHARGLQLEQMQKSNFRKQCADCNREMVESHINHPSIILWGILNECASNTPEGREMYKEQFAQIETLDSSRLLTFASCHREHDLCLDLVDVVSFNLYPLWYSDEQPAALLQNVKEWAVAVGGMKKPLIISEFGADGFYGFRDITGVKGTEERQARILEEILDVLLKDGEVSGMFIWQFCDCRVTEEGGWFHTRGMTQNSKGIVDRYRRPKLAYNIVKRLYRLREL